MTHLHEISNSHFSSHCEAALQHLLPINQHQPCIPAMTSFPKFYLFHISKEGSFFDNCYHNVRIIHELLYQGRDVFIPPSSHSNDLMWKTSLCLSSGFLVTIQYSKHLGRKEVFLLSSYSSKHMTAQKNTLFFPVTKPLAQQTTSFTPQKKFCLYTFILFFGWLLKQEKATGQHVVTAYACAHNCHAGFCPEKMEISGKRSVQTCNIKSLEKADLRAEAFRKN